MNEQIGLGAFGTFGEPFGYQQAFFLVPAIRSQLDLNTNALEVSPGSELYAVKREVLDGVSSVCCCLYTHAKEPNSNRGGTFIGACVVLRNSNLKGEDVYTLLKELHTDVVSNPKNILDSALQVQKADQLVVTEPASFNRIKGNLQGVNPAKLVAVDAQSKFLIQAPENAEKPATAAFFDTAVRYFTHTDTLYFTADKRIVAYVAEKGIIASVNWTAFQDYKTQIIQQQKEATKKIEAEKKVDKGLVGNKNTKTVAKAPATKTATYGLLEPWTNVDTSLSKEAFYKLVQNHNTLLQEYLKLSQQQIATAPPPSSNDHHQPPAPARPRHRVKRKHLIFTIIGLFALLVITTVLLLLRPASTKDVVTNTPAADSNIVAVKNTVAPPSLQPASNTELTKADAVKLVKDSLKRKKLEVIVDLIFIRNPKSIGEVYAGQKEAYAAALLQYNKNCFEGDSAKSICGCDTLMHIPAFKKLAY